MKILQRYILIEILKVFLLLLSVLTVLLLFVGVFTEAQKKRTRNGSDSANSAVHHPLAPTVHHPLLTLTFSVRRLWTDLRGSGNRGSQIGGNQSARPTDARVYIGCCSRGLLVLLDRSYDPLVNVANAIHSV